MTNVSPQKLIESSWYVLFESARCINVPHSPRNREKSGDERPVCIQKLSNFGISLKSSSCWWKTNHVIYFNEWISPLTQKHWTSYSIVICITHYDNGIYAGSSSLDISRAQQKGIGFTFFIHQFMYVCCTQWGYLSQRWNYHEKRPFNWNITRSSKR